MIEIELLSRSPLIVRLALLFISLLLLMVLTRRVRYAPLRRITLWDRQLHRQVEELCRQIDTLRQEIESLGAMIKFLVQEETDE
jgi:hypothetical protein